MAERDLFFAGPDADRSPDVVDLEDVDLAAGREAALVEVGEEQRSLPATVISISLRVFMRTIPSRAILRSATVTVGRLTPSQSARRALRVGSPSDHM